MSKWLISNGDSYSPLGYEANVGSQNDLPNPQKTVTENIKDAYTWKQLATGDGKSTLTWTEDVNEISILCVVKGQNLSTVMTLASDFISPNRYIDNGGAMSGQYCGILRIQCLSKKSITVNTFYWNATNHTDNCQVYVYGR